MTSSEHGGKFLEVRNALGAIDTHYYEAGEGSNHVVLVQTGGNATSAYMCWFENLAAFADAGCHVWAPDVAGFGQSLLRANPGQRVNASEFLVGFLDALRVPSAHFVGNSMGSNAITRLAIDHPDRVRSLILSGGEPRVETPESAVVARTLGRTPRVDFVREMLSKPVVTIEDMRRATADFFYDREHPLIDEVARMRLATNNLLGVQARDREHAFAQREGGRQNFDAADLARVRVPTYLIHGRDEPGFYGPEQARVLQEAAFRVCLLIPDCSCTFLARCGHWPQIEMAETYNALALQFLGTVGRRGRRAEHERAEG